MTTEEQKTTKLEEDKAEIPMAVEELTPQQAKKSDPSITKDVQEEEKSTGGLGLRFTLSIVFMAVIGIVVGVALSDGKGDPDVVSWVQLPGDLFLRGLRCIVLPLIFVNIFLAFVQMIQAGKASAAGLKILGLYTLTTVMASLEGLGVALFYKRFFIPLDLEDTNNLPEIRLQCPQSDTFLTVNETNVVCSAEGDNNIFELIDVNGVFEIDDGSEVADDISFSETVQDGIFRKMVPENIVVDFYNDNFLGVIMFAIVMGVASQSVDGAVNEFVKIFEQANTMFLKMVDWLILTTPIGVFSLIAGNIGQQQDIAETFANMGYFMGSAITAFSFHFCVVFPSLIFFFTRKNPWNYMKYLIPAWSVGFATGSSAATLPATLKSVESSGQVPNDLKNFVCSLGCTLNMDGTALYFSTAIIFLAVSEGLEDQLDFATYFYIILLGTIGSAGTAPVSSASMVLVITSYNTAFKTSGTPVSFGTIFAIDWLRTRFTTCINITGDATVARCVTAWINDEAHEAERPQEGTL